MRIKVSFFTVIVVILAFFSHGLVPLTHVFAIMALHETGHLVVAALFHYPIRQLAVYPFGLAVTLEHFGDRDVGEEIAVLAAGPLMHLLIPALYALLKQWGWVSPVMTAWLMQINASVLWFNLLPLYPLDGGRIVASLLHCFLPYGKAERTSRFLSIGLIPVVFITLMHASVMTLAVFLFLLVNNILSLRQLHWQRLNFYCYRLRHPPHKPVKIHHGQDLYRQRCNVFVTRGGFELEGQWLRRHCPSSSTRPPRSPGPMI